MTVDLTEAERNLAEIIWQNEPVLSSELVKICEEKFLWKKSTTYTMLKRLENKGIFINAGGVVKAALKKEAWEAKKSSNFIKENFQGSLPRFLTAFSRENRLSKREIEDLKRLIEEQEE